MTYQQYLADIERREASYGESRQDGRSPREVTELVRRLRLAGFTVGWALRSDAEYGYVAPYRINPTCYDMGDELHIDMGTIARGDDDADQTDTTLRSNYRRLHAEFDSMLTDVRYSNVTALGAFLADINDDMAELFISIAVSDGVFDDMDVHALQHDEIIESIDKYVLDDIRREFDDDSDSEAWQSLSRNERRDVFVYVMRALDYMPEHNGIEVLWDEKEYMPMITDLMQSRRWPLDDMRVNGELPSFTSIGAYPIVYLTDRDETLCAPCASKDRSVTDAGPYWEGDPLTCEECQRPIESAYGPLPGEPALF